MSRNSGRPLSPHLTIWKWGPHMLVSILHRASGDGLAIGGTLLLMWWLGALASGPEAYAAFIACVWDAEAGNAVQNVTNIIAKIIMVGLSWAFFQHMFSGLRHLLLDTGAGYELQTNRTWSMVVIAAGIIATAAFWGTIIAGTL